MYCVRPDQMLTDLVATHLSLAGFKVLRDPQQAGPSTVVLSGTLDTAFLEPKVNFVSTHMETDISLHLAATTASGLSAQRQLHVKGDEATFFGSADDMQ